MEKSEERATPGPQNGGKSNCLIVESPKEEPTRSQIFRRIPKHNEVGIEIICCGICYSDVWSMEDTSPGMNTFPMVPGHEIIGIVRIIGSSVFNLYFGQKVAIGPIIDCCRKCQQCARGNSQYCKERPITIFNSKYDKDDDCTTFGGWSTFIVVNQDFVYPIPTHLPLSGLAPMMCAGITVFSPMKYCHIGQFSHVGIAGIGGLGHIAIKIAKALNAKVTAISNSPNKKDDCLRLGANNFTLFNDNDEKFVGTMDLIIDTISAHHDIDPLMKMLAPNGKLILLGLSDDVIKVKLTDLILQRKAVLGSMVASPSEARELLNLCGMYNIIAESEVIGVDDIKESIARLKQNNVHYRFVIDIRTLKNGFNGELIPSTSTVILRQKIGKELAEKNAESDTESEDDN